MLDHQPSRMLDYCGDAIKFGHVYLKDVIEHMVGSHPMARLDDLLP